MLKSTIVMISTVIIFCITIIAMIASILFFPKLNIKRFHVDTYYLITSLGAIAMLVFGKTDVSTSTKALFSHSAINPVKILLLFISMTVLSIFLDELGFFRYLASFALKHAKSGQFKLFLYLYLTVSILTIFTSNDIIILSFTPFICYFAKNAKINPLPYLTAEFIAANTWSMALIIGNPTNIYLATACGINFAKYLTISILPTLFAGITAFTVLLLIYRKQLRTPILGGSEDVKIQDKLLLIIGVIHLGACTALLAISSYIGIEMWLVSVCSVISLAAINIIISLIRKRSPTQLLSCVKRAPYQLVPFVVSMFIIIVALRQQGVTQKLAASFGGKYPIVKYGVSSFLFSNVINNIPMSVLFSSILQASGNSLPAVFATIIGSNLGAILTPIGSLAGIMWTSVLNKYNQKFSYYDFLKNGIKCSVPTLTATLIGLRIAFLII